MPLAPFVRAGFDPDPELGRLRADQPVHRMKLPGDMPDTWLVTSHREVRTVLGDTETFSNDLTRLTAAPEWQAVARDDGGLAFRDPPQHTRLRELLTPEFTGRRLRRLNDRIDEIITAQLDAMAAAGPPHDLVATLAPIPSLVIADLLGVPEEERTEFLRRSHDRFDFSAGPDASLAAARRSVDHLEELVAQQRDDPGDGVFGSLIREHGDALGDREVAGLADGLLTGGHDTTISMLVLGALWLLQHPDQADRLREDDAHIGPLVEDLLRYMSVVQVASPRFARHDTTLGGEKIPAGGMVVCSLSAANRDPDLTADPDQVLPDRRVSRHVAFGHGIHHCIGAPLARMQLRAAYPALVRRFPTLELSVPLEEVAFRPVSIVYGIETLPVSW